MDITANPQGRAGTPAPAARTGLASDYTTFLRMLTTQMRHQDPLNPMSSSDFAVQLATFSGVEQATQTNRLLSMLLARSSLTEMGGWVGMEARSVAGAWFEGDPVSLGFAPVAGALSATLIVRDADGAIVDNRPVPADAQTMSWDGRAPDGRLLPQGRYAFELEGRRGDEVVGTTPVASFQPIREARVEGGQIRLVLPGGQTIEPEQITGLRRPGG